MMPNPETLLDIFMPTDFVWYVTLSAPKNDAPLPSILDVLTQKQDTHTVCSNQAWQTFIQNNLITIQAAGGLVWNDRKELLLIFRKHKWDLPKGKVEAKESLAEAAIREVKEETGLNILRLVKPLKPTYHLYQEQEKWILKTTHWYEMYAHSQEPIRPQREEGISEVKWFQHTHKEMIFQRTFPLIKKLIHLYPLWQ